MASDISQGEQFLWVSNQRLASLLDFALLVGSEVASSDDERMFVDESRRFSDGAWPGISFNLDEVFPQVAQRKWWGRIFHLIAGRIFRRTFGSHQNLTWQASTIGDAYVVARMLTRAVQEFEVGWHPVLDDPEESDAYAHGSIQLKS